MRLWWRKKIQKIDHSEADRAQARAFEDKHRAESKWPAVEDTLRLIEANNFGTDLNIALGRKRG